MTKFPCRKARREDFYEDAGAGINSCHDQMFPVEVHSPLFCSFHLSINDYTGLAMALLAGTGIGDLPPLVQPELLREGKLIEVMPKWHFSIFHLWIVHLGNHYMTRPVRVFKQFATQMGPKLFPKLPT